MGLLGIVIISFGFRIYTQRDTMKRHFPEIFGATILSSTFSLFSTAFAAKAIGLSSGEIVESLRHLRKKVYMLCCIQQCDL